MLVTGTPRNLFYMFGQIVVCVLVKELRVFLVKELFGFLVKELFGFQKHFLQPCNERKGYALKAHGFV